MSHDQADLDRLKEAENDSSKIIVKAPSEPQKLGATTVVCLILNRTIGSGIYVGPAIILRGTDSVGISLLFWALGAIVSTSGLLVWLELGLSIPRFEVDGVEVSVPRSGGEKNYLEYIYRRPRYLTTCMYGVMFIILGNLSGNAIVLGTYVLQAAGQPDNPSAVRGLAVAALTVACLLHALWRKGGILLNNGLAFMKVAILLLIIVLGFAALGGASFGHGSIKTSNFETNTSFSHPRSDAASYADSFLYVVYSFSGFEQPFNVLSEVSRPNRTFARATIGAMIFVALLFTLVNVAYFAVVSKAQILTTDFDMATLFFKDIFEDEIATRVMAGIIAFSVLGNIIVMTFTASRVKQEIAKEGILPFSRFFSKSTTTPFARLQSWRRSRKHPDYPCEPQEQSPAAALLLHWTFSVILVGATSAKPPETAYTVLVSLYSYVLVVLMGFLVASGLLYLRYREGKRWTSQLGFKPWGGPTAAIIYSLACAFLLIVAFLPPSISSPFSYQITHVQWYIVPSVGLASLLLGVVYYGGFQYVVPWLKGKQMVLERLPIVIRDEFGEYVMTHEIVEFQWEPLGEREEDIRENF